MMEIFKLAISITSYAIESVGVVIIVLGLISSARRTLSALPAGDRGPALDRFRREFAQSTLVGMEFLVAGDIIRTVIVSHSLNDVLTLALLVAIRTVLVFTLHLELEGRWPWQQSTSPDNPSGATAD